MQYLGHFYLNETTTLNSNTELDYYFIILFLSKILIMYISLMLESLSRWTFGRGIAVWQGDMPRVNLDILPGSDPQ